MDNSTFLSPSETETKPAETFNDVLMNMFDASMNGIIDMIPGFKRIVMRDAIKIVRPYIAAKVNEFDQNEIRDGLLQYSRMMGAFAARIETWNGENARELMEGLGDDQQTDSTEPDA